MVFDSFRFFCLCGLFIFCFISYNGLQKFSSSSSAKGGMPAQELVVNWGGKSFTSESESYLYTCRCALTKFKGIFTITSWNLSLVVSSANQSKNIQIARNKLSRATGNIFASFLFTLITVYWQIRLKATQYNVLY